jgi:hypothetical protein
MRKYFYKKQKLDTFSNGQITIKDFHDSNKLPKGWINRIDRALVKFFVTCKISFRIVEHLFFVDFVKELNARYNLFTCKNLSNHLLKNELCHVNNNIRTDLTLNPLKY